MARVKKNVRSSRIDLRKAYDMGGYKSDYAWFVRTKVVPILGDRALQVVKPREGSRTKEYSVTVNNFKRLMKSLNIEIRRMPRKITTKSNSNIRKIVRDAGPEMTAILIERLVERVGSSNPDPEFPIKYRIPIHPISHNMLYGAHGSRFHRTARYNEWRSKFFQLVKKLVPKDTRGVDFTKPLEVVYYFGHREFSSLGHVFDRPNFQKAAQDCIFEHFGFEDSKALNTSVRGEFVKEYSDGFLEFSIRNS